MCHISYKETKARSNQRKPGTARGRWEEGKTREMASKAEKAEASTLISRFFPLRSVGREPLVAHTHKHKKRQKLIIQRESNEGYSCCPVPEIEDWHLQKGTITFRSQLISLS